MYCFDQVHHKIPRFEGGDDSEENLIHLSLEEHALAHLERAILSEDPIIYAKNMSAAILIAFGQGARYEKKLFDMFDLDTANDLTNQLYEIRAKIKDQCLKRPVSKKYTTVRIDGRDIKCTFNAASRLS